MIGAERFKHEGTKFTKRCAPGALSELASGWLKMIKAMAGMGKTDVISALKKLEL
jgi:hypothetical protein